MTEEMTSIFVYNILFLFFFNNLIFIRSRSSSKIVFNKTQLLRKRTKNNTTNKKEKETFLKQLKDTIEWARYILDCVRDTTLICL